MTAPDPLDPELAAAIERHKTHFLETMGRFPDSFATMSRVAPEVFDGYSRMREWVMRDPPEGHLPAKYKHLIFLVLDALHDNEHGALLHTRAAVEAGLTIGELTEAMVLLMMLWGVNTWGKQGRRVVEYAEELLRK